MTEEKKNQLCLFDSLDEGRRRSLLTVVSALIHENGFDYVEKEALETLVQLLQGFILDIGKLTKGYAEVASRVEPNVGDLFMALSHFHPTFDTAELRSYARRHTRPTVSNPQPTQPPKVPQLLGCGKRRNLPGHIPEFFPTLPDPHTYIRTPTHKQPLADYAICRERMSQQKRDLQFSLAKFYARTSSCFQFFPDNRDMFPIMLPKETSYLSGVVNRDQMFDSGSSLPRFM